MPFSSGFVSTVMSEVIDGVDMMDEVVPKTFVPPEMRIGNIECTTFDLKAFIARYQGYTKLKRLQFIIDRSKNLRVSAYYLLMDECKKGNNVDAYISSASQSQGILGHQYEIDQEWIDSTQRKMNARLEKLTTESSSARSSMINESIRLSYHDLGYHYYDIGNMHEAHRLFSRMRDYCSTQRHQADLAFSITNCMLDLSNFSIIPTYFSKTCAFLSLDALTTAKSKAILGIYELHEKNYSESARWFLSVDKELESNFSSVIAPEDVATYGVLLGLASLERVEFKRLVESKTFKAFLELVPDMQILASKTLSRSYGEAINKLNLLRSEWKLDIYLSPHVDLLISKISDKIIIEYFVPYSAVSILKMSAALDMDVESLETKLFNLIVANKLNALIDDEGKILVRRSDLSREQVLSNVMSLSKTHLQSLKDGLLRLSIIKNGLTLISDGLDSGSGVNKIDSSTRASLMASLPGFGSDDYPRHAMMEMPSIARYNDMEDYDESEDKD